MSKSDLPRKEPSESSLAGILEREFEPLSEQRWHKIEQRVFARLNAAELPGALDSNQPTPFWRRRASGWVLASAATLLLVIFALSRSNGGSIPSVSRISTGVTASHVVLPGVVLDVGPESAVLVSGNAEESALIVLDRGEVKCDVAHRRPGASLFVQAGELSVEVVGTRFTVRRQEDVASVSVQEGVVRVKLRGRSTSVKAGETWPPALTAAANSASSVPEVRRSSELPEVVSSADSSVDALRPREPASKPRVIKEAKAGSTGNTPTTEDSTPSVRQRFERATQIEPEEPAEAIRLYEGIENGGSSWAANALFAHGRLEAARGNRVAGRRILTQYLRRFPAGANAPDARLLLSRLE